MPACFAALRIRSEESMEVDLGFSSSTCLPWAYVNIGTAHQRLDAVDHRRFRFLGRGVAAFGGVRGHGAESGAVRFFDGSRVTLAPRAISQKPETCFSHSATCRPFHHILRPGDRYGGQVFSPARDLAPARDPIC